MECMTQNVYLILNNIDENKIEILQTRLFYIIYLKANSCYICDDIIMLEVVNYILTNRLLVLYFIQDVPNKLFIFYYFVVYMK